MNINFLSWEEIIIQTPNMTMIQVYICIYSMRIIIHFQLYQLQQMTVYNALLFLLIFPVTDVIYMMKGA